MMLRLLTLPGDLPVSASCAHGTSLGDVCYGEQPLSGEANATPTTRMPLPVLGPSRRERWVIDRPVAVGTRGAVAWAECDDVLFGTIELAEDPATGADLEAISAEAYSALLALAGDHQFPHLWRIWNVLPWINVEDRGLERYRRFCRARAHAFEAAYGGSFHRRLCASTAVGSHGGDALVVHFLAGREPGIHRENPRQVSAYRYPCQYGPKSPSFARATVLPQALGGTLFISGTASIVGHETLHVGDLAGQIDETVRNLEVMLTVPDDTATVPARRFDQLKVYLRHTADQEAVAAALASAFGAQVPIVFLHSDICRADLLLEIEAVASPA
jgi:chorismate lyase/3-hydroxybenzoate synthase